MYTKYRKQANTKRQPPSAKGSNRNSHDKLNRSYTIGEPIPRASERDRRCLAPTKPEKEKERITRGVEEKEKEPPVVEKKELETKLHVTGVDLHIPENVKDHNTDLYECTEDRIRDSDSKKMKAELVIRRGQEFKMTIKFDRPFSIKQNDIILMFNLGDDYKPNKNLNACFTVDETGDTKYKPRKWGATVVDKNDKENKLTVKVFVPATVPIGEWDLSIRTIVDRENGKPNILQYNHKTDFIKILFNPFCKADLTYVEDEDWRNETVLSDSGAVYTGSWRKIGVRSWFFGQFEDGILDAAMYLVRRSFGFEATPAMASPGSVSRMISTIVNSCDDDGVLVGNWSGDYSGGKKPTSWNGSVAILLQYMKTGIPVRYGQCWVFSGVVTAVCRALGIPCRSVTNHSSAHNTDPERLSIDTINKLNADGEWFEIKNDSVWNFHVWNECWFRRPDLNKGDDIYDGWQVIDATPQEYSYGMFCCGPAPVIAIKLGQLDVGKDTQFVYAEVNADKVEWKENVETGRLFERKRCKHSVGKSISTHKPTGEAYKSSTFGSLRRFFGGDTMERLELRDIYKHAEGSEEERKINRCAEKKYRLMSGYFDDCDDSDHECEEEEPFDLVIEDDDDDLMVGEGFDFKVEVKNRGTETRTMDLVLKVLNKTYYDTITGVALKEKHIDVKLKPGDCKKYTVKVDSETANKRPQDGFNFEMKAVASFKESDHIATEDMDFRLRRPDLVVKGPSKCGRTDTIKVEVSFTNPMKLKLTKCEIDLEGGFKCVGTTKKSFRIADIDEGKTWTTTLHLQPTKHPERKKERELVIGFDSRELSDICGTYNVTLK